MRGHRAEWRDRGRAGRGHQERLVQGPGESRGRAVPSSACFGRRSTDAALGGEASQRSTAHRREADGVCMSRLHLRQTGDGTGSSLGSVGERSEDHSDCHSRRLGEGPMDRINSRIPQAYGYAVCFITVIMMLVSIKSVVDAAFDLSDPLRAEAGGRPITNFELYKAAERSRVGAKDPNGPVPPVTA